MFKGKKVFISGGAGVIGRPLTQKLIEAGAFVTVGDLKPRPIDFPAAVDYRQGDLNDLSQDEVNALKPAYFFHLAATFERSEESYGFWAENYHHNLALSHHLMGLFKETQFLKAVIFASSYLIYDAKLYLRAKPQGQCYRLNESDAINPRNLTGAAKLNHEIELNFLNTFMGKDCRFLSVRIFRGYGKGSRDVVSRWVRSLIKGEPIKIYGKENRFDYIYANDTAEGLLRLATHSQARGVYNLGTGKAKSIVEVTAALKKHFPNAEWEDDDEGPLYEESEADIAKLTDLLNWKPVYSIEKAIPEIIAYEQSAQEDPHALGDILITSISKKVPLIQAVKAAARKLSDTIKVWGADRDSHCLGRHFVDNFWEMPLLDELTGEFVLEYCLGHGIRFIIPTRDGELLFFAKYRDLFAQKGVSIMVSQQATVANCIDKMAFYNALDAADYSVIDTAKAIGEAKSGSWVVKEATSSGSRDVKLKLSQEEACAYAVDLKSPIFQPYVEGKELSADVYITQKGHVKGVVLRWRDYVLNGESQVSSTFRNLEYEKRIAAAAVYLGIYGHAVFQGIVTSESDLYLIEANCRFGGASSLSLATGLDSFYWFLLESLNYSLDAYPFKRTSNKRLVRFPSDSIESL